MPRTARASVGDYCYHIINRGNGRAQVFHADGDYQAFITLLREASLRIPMRLPAIMRSLVAQLKLPPLDFWFLL